MKYIKGNIFISALLGSFIFSTPILLVGFLFLQLVYTPGRQQRHSKSIKTAPQSTLSYSPEISWVISISNNEVQAKIPLDEPNLLYATKNKKHVNVYKKNLQSGEESDLFEYDEYIEATYAHGNSWEQLPANIALSPNKKLIAYMDGTGLKIYDIMARTKVEIITQLTSDIPYSDKNHPKEMPVWIVKDLSAYHLAKPAWSFDSNYISFTEIQYEGAGFGIININTGKYSKDQLVGTGRVWSPTSLAVLKYGAGGYGGWGLNVSNPADLNIVTDLAQEFSQTGIAYFTEALYSPDGQKIAFVSSESSQNSPTYTLGIVDSTGQNYMKLNSGLKKSALSFSPDNRIIYFIEEQDGVFVLHGYDLVDKKDMPIARLPNDFYQWSNPQWTKEGYLMLVGLKRQATSSISSNEDTKQIILIDINNHALVYTSPRITSFATFAGFLR